MSASPVSTLNQRHLHRNARPAAHPAGQLTREWRGWGAPQQIASPYPWARYAYTANGQRASVWDAGDSRTAYGYDGLNRMISVSEQASDDASPARLAALAWTPLSKPQRLDYGPAGASVAGVAATYTASGAGADVERLSHDFAAGGNDVGFDYTYFADHRLASQAISRPSFRPAAPAAYVQTYSPDRLNRYAQVSGPPGAPPIVFSYDGNGNLTSDGAYTFAYDPENRLLSADNVLMGALYDSDPLGRRVRTRVTDKLASPQTTVATSFQLDGEDEIAEISGGVLLRRFVPGAAIDRPVAMVLADGSRRYFHADRQGSVIALSDGAGALADGPYAYDPYGLPQGSGLAAALTDSPYLFTGRRYDPETGLYYLRARYYSPALGRFPQTDPVGYEGGDLNLYAYVANDPVNGMDPLGLFVYLSTRQVIPGFFVPTGLGIIYVPPQYHMYLATHAEYVGDPNAKIYSWGPTSGAQGARDSNDPKRLEQQFEGPLNENDRRVWSSKDSVLPGRTTQIAADDDIADVAAQNVLGHPDYDAMPTGIPGEGANSNSAAYAAAQDAERASGIRPRGQPTPTPKVSTPGREVSSRVQRACKVNGSNIPTSC